MQLQILLLKEDQKRKIFFLTEKHYPKNNDPIDILYNWNFYILTKCRPIKSIALYIVESANLRNLN